MNEKDLKLYKRLYWLLAYIVIPLLYVVLVVVFR